MAAENKILDRVMIYIDKYKYILIADMSAVDCLEVPSLSASNQRKKGDYLLKGRAAAAMVTCYNLSDEILIVLILAAEWKTPIQRPKLKHSKFDGSDCTKK